MQQYQTEQEKFWAGEFGHEYIKRNEGADALAIRTAFFAKSIFCIPGEDVCSCIEFGANIGLNLLALRYLRPRLEVSAVEIDTEAAMYCAEIPNAHLYNRPFLIFSPMRLMI